MINPVIYSGFVINKQVDKLAWLKTLLFLTLLTPYTVIANYVAVLHFSLLACQQLL